MFGYVSIAELSSQIRSQFHRVPATIELVVGIPRSGMIPAYLIGLFMNRPVLDLEAFLAGAAPAHGHTRPLANELRRPLEAAHILLVDDSLNTGDSMRKAVERIRSHGVSAKITRCAAIVVPEQRALVDLSFVVMPHPRIFEWNAFHLHWIENACFDLDGVLCVDPSARQNDDGPRYQRFLEETAPLFKPTQRIGHIVSARLERYRAATERWLRSHGIAYGQLHLMDVASGAERARRGGHAEHKARVYLETGAALFYESDPAQAREIARLSRRPVLCVGDMSMQLPGGMHPATALRSAKFQLHYPVGFIKGWLRHRLQRGPTTAVGPR
jgi:uncharacterized HAD superfamily protein/hypoxanthine phosphoribosyltransferase